MSRALVSSIVSPSGRAVGRHPLCRCGLAAPSRVGAAGDGGAAAAAKRWGHSVRLIALEDLPHGRAYKGDVLSVKAGYARNYLLPQKMALYATPQNFDRLDMVDPDVETEEQRLARRQRESSMSAVDDKHLKQADLLKKYLKNKTLKLWRVVDPNSATDALHPGVVTSSNIRQKLSKQLKIDLDDNEAVHIYSDTPLMFNELNDNRIQTMVDEFDPAMGTECNIKIKRLGEYLAKISLGGNYSVPLKFVVLQRVP